MSASTRSAPAPVAVSDGLANPTLSEVDAFAQPAAPVASAASGFGRPFLVAGELRFAATVLRDDWCEPIGVDVSRLSQRERGRLAHEWDRIALLEHASIAAFARFVLQLLSLGAPPSLLEATHQALRDETEHARLAFGLASLYRGQAVGPGPMDVDRALDAGDVSSILALSVIEGCVGETVASLEAVEALAAVRDPALRSILDKFARDEQRHAELSWKFVRWVFGARPDLRAHVRRVVDEQVANAKATLQAAEPDPASDWLLRNGLVSASRRCELRVQVLRDVVVPSLDALCASIQAHQAA